MNGQPYPPLAGLFRQLIAFAGVGLVATIADYAVFLALFSGFALDPTPAALIGYLAGGAVSYGLSRRHVFKSSRSHRAALIRFIGVMALGFLLTGGTMHLFVDGLSVAPPLARILTYAVVLAFNFVAHRFFTFGR